MTKTPQAVLDALEKLDAGDRETVQSYISDLQTKLKDLPGDQEDEEFVDVEQDEDMPDLEPAEDTTPTEPDFPPVYSSGEDFDKAADFKQQAADAKAEGDWEKALDFYTQAVLAAPPSALLYANRANALLKLDRPKAAERDCDLAVKENPDSAKALRIRGKARKELGQWEAALKDLSASQTIDFDEGTVDDLKFLTEKHLELEKAQADERNEKEEKMRKRASEIRKAQEEAKREAESSASSGGGGGGGSPFGGGGGGSPFGGSMPGAGGSMPGGNFMSDLMNDPELLAAMQNPKVQSAFQQMMGSGGQPDPSKVQELLSDPEVGPIMKKLMDKLGVGGGMPGAAAATGDDGIPNLDEMEGDVDLDDLPDLE